MNDRPEADKWFERYIQVLRQRDEERGYRLLTSAALSYALHAFRAQLSYGQNEGLARGELACLIGLGEEWLHGRMGHLPYEVEQQVRESLKPIPADTTSEPPPVKVRPSNSGSGDAF